MRSLYNLSGLFLSKLDLLKNEKAWIGFENMFDDFTVILVAAAPIVGGLVIVYYLIRKSIADEQDQKIWRDKIKITIFSTIGALVAVSILNFILSYFQ